MDAERYQRDRDHLEIGEPERNADDRQAQRDAAGQVAECQPPADQDDPDYVPDERADARVPADLNGTAEWPDHVRGDPERRDPERDRDDQDEADDSRKDVENRHPPAAQDQPDQVENEPENTHRITAFAPPGRTSMAASRRAVVAATSSTADSNAAALRA